MTAPDRRSFMAAAAASIATPVGLGAKECPTSAALCGYTLAPEASLTQITNELKSAFDWLDATAGEHGVQGPIIVTGWSAGGHLTSFILDHPTVAAGLAISGVFDLAFRQ
jgi:arylformamidase